MNLSRFFWIVTLFSWSSLSYAQEPQHSYRVLLFLKANTRATLQIPEDCDVYAKRFPLVSVRCDSVIDKKRMEEFKKIPGVKSISPVVPLRIQQTHGTSPLPSNPYSPSLGESSVDADGTCRLSKLCPDGRNQFWAQERVQGDLMFAELTRMGVKNGSASVAVVDSGFDMSRNRDLMQSPSFAVHKGWDHAGDPSKDENGHGTAVSGLIGGKQGVGLAPNLKLNVYRVTESGNEGSTGSDSLKLSILKACEDGNNVINVSWGGWWDENGFGEEEETHKDFYDLMASKGCLIVKSAGNSARRIRRKHLNPDDALLRVEALEVSGNLASFSSNGEISAPGHGVFTHRSSQVDAESYNKYCGKESGAFANGTSFSAPITSAIAGQVVAVLNQNPEYSKMSGPDRVSLINRVLIASSMQGQLNGHRAVLMAEMWSRGTLGNTLPTQEALKVAFKSFLSDRCQNQVTACARAYSCDKKRNCYQALRAQMNLCEPPKKSHFDELLRLTAHSRETDSTMALLHTAKGVPGVQDAELIRISRKTWEELHQKWSESSGGLEKNMSFDQSLEILPFLMQHKSRLGVSTDRDTALLDFLKSDQVLKRLARDKAAGSDQDLNRILDLMALAQKSLTKNEMIEIIKNTNSHWLSPDKLRYSWNSAGPISVSARFLDALQRDSRFQGLKTELDSLERELIPLIANHSVDSNPSDLGIFHGIMERNPDIVWRIWKTPSKESEERSSQKSKEGISIGRSYLLENIDRIPEPERLSFVLNTFDSVIPSKDELQKRQSQELSFMERKALEQSTRHLGAELSKLNPERRTEELNRYWDRMGSLDSLSLRLSAYPQPVYAYMESRRKIFESEALYSVPQFETHVLETVDLLNRSQQQRRMNPELSNRVIAASMHYLLKEEGAPRARKLFEVLVQDLESHDASTKDGPTQDDVIKWIHSMFASASGVDYAIQQTDLFERLDKQLATRATSASRAELRQIERLQKLMRETREKAATRKTN